MVFNFYKLKDIIFFSFSFQLISILDNLVWILIKVLPNKFVIKIIEIRIFRKFKIPIPRKYIFKVQPYIIRVLRFRTNKSFYLSSCLSLSISIQFIFDLLGIENKIFLGMHKKDGKKIPHAWISFIAKEKYIQVSKIKAVVLKSI